MITFIRKWFERNIIKRSTISVSEWQDAFASLPLLVGLSSADKKQLQDLAILFLHGKVIEGANGFVVTPKVTLIIALQACLPILKLGLEYYSGWLSVIVYPSGFAPKRVFTDEYGVEHHMQSNLAGESWQRGPVILSWDETEFAGAIDGSNLVIHEFVHKLDMQNGTANGYPPLHSNMKSKEWVEAFSSGFKKIQKQCHSGKGKTIDCYAATSPAEFFAVMSEVFFECPDVVRKHYNAIYKQLCDYYRQDPLGRLH